LLEYIRVCSPQSPFEDVDVLRHLLLRHLDLLFLVVSYSHTKVLHFTHTSDASYLLTISLCEDLRLLLIELEVPLYLELGELLDDLL
jgi:hypothetical protein